MKICNKCEKIKSLDEFSWKIKAKNIKSSWCKLCQSEYDKQYYKINYDKTRKRTKQYQKDHLEKFREYNRQYRDRNPEKVKGMFKISSKKYRKNNLQKVRDCNRLCSEVFRKNNPEKIKERTRRYNSNHVEEIKKQSKKYRKNNRGKVRARNAQRRALKLLATPIDANREIINFYYQLSSTLKDYHVDHIKPLSKGGLHHENNLQILSSKLNLEKFNKWPLTKEEQERYKGFRVGEFTNDSTSTGLV